MNRASGCALSALLLSLCACGSVGGLLPDGGRARNTCSTDFTSMAVRVVDAKGAPVEGATVTATNPGLNLTQTGTTDSSGNTLAINQDLGQGTATLKATLGSRVTDTKNCTWTCSDQCLCAVEPKTLTLTLSP